MDTIAYVWASGRIEFTTPKRTPRVPDGAIAIARGERQRVRYACMAAARLGQGKSAGKLLVPGIPEADTAEQKLKALHTFRMRIQPAIQAHR